MDYQQTHTLPGAPDALAHLAQRLGFQGPAAGTCLWLGTNSTAPSSAPFIDVI